MEQGKEDPHNLLLLKSGDIEGNPSNPKSRMVAWICLIHTNQLVSEVDSIQGEQRVFEMPQWVSPNGTFLTTIRNIKSPWTHRLVRAETLKRILSLLPPALIPPIHIGVLYYFWHGYSHRVDKKYCTCSCWDTVFKGPYESGVGSFKHFYFNATKNTIKIWFTTVLSIVVFYESVKRLLDLGLKKRLRYSMLTLFLSAVFSHYYSWWAYLNYWNDEFYKQWNHQLYFTITELFSTWSVLELADAQRVFTRRKALFIVGIAVIHIITGSLDQFVTNVLKGSGKAHQVLRDVWFMFPDVLHVILPTVELLKAGKTTKGLRIFHEIFTTATMVVLGLYMFFCL